MVSMFDKKINKGKKAQLDMPIITFIVFIIGIIILAPFLLKIINAILVPFGNGLGGLSPQGNQSAQYVVATTNTFWDFGIVLAFLIIMILMFVTAYFIDVHPMFVIIYIILGFIMFLSIPAMQDTFKGIYDAPTFNPPEDTTIINMPMTNFLQSHFSIIVLALYVITGVIMYGKMRLRSMAEG